MVVYLRSIRVGAIAMVECSFPLRFGIVHAHFRIAIISVSHLCASYLHLLLRCFVVSMQFRSKDLLARDLLMGADTFRSKQREGFPSRRIDYRLVGFGNECDSTHGEAHYPKHHPTLVKSGE